VRYFLGAATSFLLASISQAGILPITLDSLGAGDNVTITVNGQSQGVFAGQFNMTFNEGTQISQSFNTFCIDIDHHVSMGQTYKVEQKDVSGFPGGAGGQMEYLFVTYGQGVLTNDQAAAVEIALWELSKGSDTFSYTANANVTALVNTYLLDSTGQSQAGFWQDASAQGDYLDRGQSLIGPPDFGSLQSSSVPEPSSLILLMLGAGGLSAFRRIRA
jgi:hypothetical protein